MALTQERLKEVLRYCPETGLFYWRERRGSQVAGGLAGVIAHDKARTIRVDRVLYRAHRLAWLYMHGSFPSGEVDHINGDPSDNRIANLRDCSRADNAKNVRVHCDTASGLKGAYRDKKRWTSKIYANGKNHHLGNFDTPELAAAAYDAAALRLHGEFACTNGRLP